MLAGMIGNVFKAYDVRGVYPSPLNEALAWRIGYASSSFLLDEAAAAGQTTPMMKSLIVGRDMRTSSPALVARLTEGVLAQGGSVVDVGLVDTPFVYFAINRLDCAGGVMTTASHNPPEYNGFKISRSKAKPVGAESGLNEIRRRAALADERRIEPVGGRHEERDLWDAYRDHVLSFLDLGGVKLKIVIDASNAMAGTMAPKIFGEAGSRIDGLEIIELNFKNDTGEFAHPPDPLVRENLLQLQEKVRETGADLGFCFDGDGDRCMIVDERGEIVGCDLLTAWLSRAFLKENPKSAIVYDLRSSKAVEEEIRKAGGTPTRSRVGHVFMKQALAEHGASFGGELSGHFYFRDNFNCDSGAIAMASVLTALARAGEPMSKIIQPLARYQQSGEINFEVEDKEAALDDLKRRYADKGTIDELDGVTVNCFKEAGWWCNVRMSNTEPLLRLNLEARNDSILNRMVEEISPMLG